MYKKIIEDTVTTFQKGGIVLYPTDTIWGLGCDATNVSAIEKIYAIKERDHNKSLLILCADIDQLRHYVTSIPQAALDILNTIKIPTTIIYPQACNLPVELMAADGSIGIRIPNMDFCHEVLKQLGKPIVSTSANFSKKPSPLSFHEIDSELIKMVDHVVPNLPELSGSSQSSQILKINDAGNIIVIRK